MEIADVLERVGDRFDQIVFADDHGIHVQPFALFWGFGASLDLHRRSGKGVRRSEEHTSELQSLMRNSYAVFCLKKKKKEYQQNNTHCALTKQKYNLNNA